ncbi:recombination-associated protein RdgC [Opacimonas viscosa]|uniref:Recombination-associated protein RdgC n=1 Tax=Opacimonas viscosa TaxID=2961944 RepID=A0AA41X101_9ALTE|nr:recombination-associated protein RdgC [Opacimonas viscosa]MCP3427877.1 recombination-associated protein RdgC [Opacimonas viscosa]
MWFKNAKLYQLTQPLSFDDENLQECLNNVVFRPCGSQELATMGFAPPMPGGKELFHAVGENYLFCLKKQERILPAAVINAELADKVLQIEQEQGSPVGKKAQQDLKEEIVQRLLPQAFTKNSFTFGFISLKENLVIVDASADGKAEVLLAMLRKALGSLPVVPLCRSAIHAQLTHWITETPPAEIELLQEAELKAHDDEGAIVRCKNQDLTSEEIIQHIDNGKMVEKIAVGYAERVTLLLEQDCSVKRLKYADILKEENQDIPKDQQAARFDADYALMSAELIELAKFLQKTFALDDAAE